jgi:hypothetical protein
MAAPSRPTRPHRLGYLFDEDLLHRSGPLEILKSLHADGASRLARELAKAFIACKSRAGTPGPSAPGSSWRNR